MTDNPAGTWQTDDDVTDTGAGAWRTLAEAAVALGLSERTIHRRIDAGRLRARQEDGHMLVWLPAGAGVWRTGGGQRRRGAAI